MHPVILYKSGRGADECQLISRIQNWDQVRDLTISMLDRQFCPEAADMLRKEGFALYEATNGFGDEFEAISRKANREEYIRYAERAHGDEQLHAHCRELIGALRNFSHHIRFVTVELDVDGHLEKVESVIPESPGEAVRQALQEADRLLDAGNPVSAVDRVHTGLHGYLRWICKEAGTLPAEKDPGLTALVKQAALHPKVKAASAHSPNMALIINGFSKAIAGINEARNRGSLAHANEVLLDEADANLVINASKTIIHYFKSRLE